MHSRTLLLWRVFSASLLILFFAILPSITFAEWPSNSIINLPISSAPGDQESPKIVTDGEGGAIIVWKDKRSDGGDIYAQRVDVNGAVLWTIDGVPISTRQDIQDNPVVTPDGAGGAIIVWEDWSFGGAVYAQRVNYNGILLWNEDGVLIAGDADQQQPSICSDGANGAIIAWEAGPQEWMDIYAQRIDGNGVLQWQSKGAPVSTAPYMQRQPQIISDDEGGAIIAWLDLRDYQAVDGVYTQRIDSNGSALWQTNGVEIVQWGASRLDITADGAGGAIIAWADNESGEPDKIYAQRVDGSGTELWATNGVLIARDDSMIVQSLDLVSDGTGGAIIVWGPYGIYAQRVDNNGTTLWITNGIFVFNAEGNVRLVSDGTGGAIITRDDVMNFDIYAQRVDADGTALWTTDGVPISTATGGQWSPEIISDGAGGAIITWKDARIADHNIYAQKVNAYGTLGETQQPEIDYFSISGTVTLNGLGLQGVNITLSGATSNTTSTTTDGTFSFANLTDGSYTITPNLDGYTFNPTSITVTISGANVSGIDFRACDTSVPFSGVLRDATTNKPLSGITVTVDGIHTDVTDSNGYYEISGLSCGDHEIMVDVPSGYSSYTRTIYTSENPTWNIFLTKPETVYGPDTFSGYGPDPVNTATGNYICQKKELEIPGRGLSFVFNRHYNSQSGEDKPLGFGWGHTYDVALTVDADSNVTIRWGDGKTETWSPDGLGGFTPQYGVFDTLIDNGDGTYTLKKKDLREYTFDTSGRLSNIVDKNGNSISLTYTGEDLTQTTDTVGRNIDFTYDQNNRITVVTDPIGRTVHFAYDPNGDLVSSTDMNGNTTTYTYDNNHQLLTVVDPRGNTVVTNVYDDQKRVVISQSDAKGGQTTYTYEEVDKKTTITDPLGNTCYHYHDEMLRLIRQEDALGNSAYYTYDSAGNRTEVTDKNGNTTTYTYDTNGNVLTKTDALANTTTITYDENNNPLTRTDSLGNTTTYEYDGNGNLTKTTDPLGNVTTVTYDAYGQPLTITNARGNTTTYEYDTEGNLIEVTDALGNKTTYTYDGVGRRLTVTNALGKTTTYSYDNNNNLLTATDTSSNVTTYTYDENNNRLTVTDPLGNITSYTYDVKDLLTAITDPLGNIVTYIYDGLDRKTSVTDKNGNGTAYTYDEAGNLTTITDPLGNSTTYTYDANGNKLTETDPLGQTVTYAYDALNRLVSVTDPLGNTTTTTYDALGRVTATTNAKGQTTDFEYDAMGRITKVTDHSAGAVIYSYDENGNRISITNPNGNATTYSYDALDRVTQKVEPLGSVYQYTYNAVGNKVGITDANGSTINYSYDANNRLVAINYPDGSTFTLTYDANGNRNKMVDNLGTSTYTYDDLNRMTSYTDPFGNTVAYGYDANGNRTSLTYPDGKVVTYTYDALNRLTTVTDWLMNETIYTYDPTGNLISTLNPSNTKATYTYDAAGRLMGLSNTKSDSSIISSYSYTLDAIGNHTKVVQTEPLAPVLTDQSVIYTYDAENRLTGVDGTTYSYDANGNLTGKGSDIFTYDFEDRLVQSNIGGVVTQYSYDGLGNRLAKTESGINTRYVLDINGSLSNVLAVTEDNGTIIAYYVYGLGLISKLPPDGTGHYYHYDSRGSTVAVTDAEENITNAYAYDTFGTLSNSSGSIQNPFKYVGRYGVMDEGNGLYYIRARYYSSENGRFITKDPRNGDDRDAQSLNRYLYALNNPVRLIDISGFSALEGRVSRTIQQSSDEIHNGILDLAKRDEVLRSAPSLTEDQRLENEELSQGIDKLVDFFSRGIIRIAKAGASKIPGVSFVLTGVITMIEQEVQLARKLEALAYDLIEEWLKTEEDRDFVRRAGRGEIFAFEIEEKLHQAKEKLREWGIPPELITFFLMTSE